MTPEVDAVAFGVLAALTVGGALGMLTTRNVVHAAFWMLELMLATAGLFLLLSAEFLALVQIMVYAGAVAVLILFVVMLTLRRREDAIRPRDFSLPSAGIAALIAAVITPILTTFRGPAVTFPDVTPGVKEFGTELFTTWLVPFEVASLVLLVALVGAVWWAKGVEQR